MIKDPKKLAQRMSILCILIGFIALAVGIIAMAMEQYIIAIAMGIVTVYMAPGVNLGNTMEACDWNDVFTNQAGLKSETSWQNDKTTESYIRSLKQQGFNSLRIPTYWVAGHLTDKENMTIDPVWMKRIKEIVNYGLNAGLCVIINEHWDRWPDRKSVV